jgi:signal transduction histidine kinase/FixJ family two-component response regulator
LEPAVEGYIPLQEICKVPPRRMEDVIWIGDAVDAVITNLQIPKRRVALSVRKHLAQLENRSARARYQRHYFTHLTGTGAPMSDLISGEDRLALLNFAKARQNPGDEQMRNEDSPSLASRLRRILIADDDPSFRVSLSSLLKRLGHQVDVAETAEDAVRQCLESTFDLVLMDVRFKRGMNGLQGAQEIASSGKNMPLLMMTGSINSNSDHKFISSAKETGAVGVLHKPIPLRSLTRRMALIADGKDCWDVEAASTDPNMHSQFGSTLGALPRQLNFQEIVSHELMKLQRETQSSACILFHMALETRVVTVVTHTGSPLTAYDTNKYTLQATPIQEVIRQGAEVVEEDVSRNPQRFKYLNLIEYASCIGIPVEMLGQTRYAVFLFHPEKGHFTGEHLRLARGSAAIIGSIINRGEVEHVIRRVQPLVFAGQIGSTLIHELNNRLGSVLNYAETLLVDHETIEKDVAAAMDSQLRARIKTSIKSLETNVRGMEQITSLYLGLMSVETSEIVRLNETVQRALSVMAPMAERNHVEIVTDFEPNLPGTIAVGSWLEQAFVNVALNAIQHITLAKGSGELLVQTRLGKHLDTLCLQVVFTDTGPGIHSQHLDHIFELGFSTRTDGTGLGLFATKGLIEGMGGKVKVLSSVMFVGTTILIELPLIVPSVEDPTHDG